MVSNVVDDTLQSVNYSINRGRDPYGSVHIHHCHELPELFRPITKRCFSLPLSLTSEVPRSCLVDGYRPDVDPALFDQYMKTVFSSLDQREDDSLTHSHLSIYQLSGLLLSFKYLLKNGERKKLKVLLCISLHSPSISLVPQLSSLIDSCSLLIQRYNSLLIKKYIYKVLYYTAVLFLNASDYSWRYDKTRPYEAFTDEILEDEIDVFSRKTFITY